MNFLDPVASKCNTWGLMVDTRSEYIAESKDHVLFATFTEEAVSKCTTVTTTDQYSPAIMVKLLQNTETFKKTCR